ncbi:GNAT family N-acetyltransferase [Floricoccus penangensis]|uniref:GNAT family N-acetyltransferase n=1 Tax=Floricoccus penangensis TaxID=1859475 RepID=UPI002041CAE4|nr:GNAT family N-acetyltransferase [Floricoccus penangensis]URZ86829.1 GNAT family N-acetyltransferase [Floricoccus penangensis]
MNKLRFENVDDSNREQVLKIKPFDEQINFIESVEECLNEADEMTLFYKERRRNGEKTSFWQPMAVYDVEDLIGFIMYGHMLSTSDRLWLDRILVDKNFQSMGYGKRIVADSLALLAGKFPGKKVYLSVYDNNVRAIKIYQDLGFAFNGELDDGGEKVMETVLPAI